MKRRRITVSLPEELVEEVRRGVREGRASSLSAYIADALREKSGREKPGRHDLQELLDEWDRELGPPGPEAVAWAKRAGLEKSP